MTPARPRVLFISADPVGADMAGLGIRYYELARALSDRADVVVAHGGSGEGAPSDVETVPYRVHDPVALRPLIAAADTIVTHPQWPRTTAWLRRASARVVMDLYDPETLETLELFADRRPAVRRAMVATTLDRLHDALGTGHHFLCASEKQRDLWLGAMLAQRRITPSAYDRDPSFRSIIDVVPFGVPAEPPAQATGPGPRERFAGVGPGAEVVLWNGGLWRWLDPATAIRAAGELAARRPHVRLVFMGASDHAAAREQAARSRALAAELGLLDRVVFFNDAWVGYAERVAWLEQADCAVSTHPDHLETRFAYRTRIVDCWWAGLPVVSTAGDDLGDRLEREGLGAAVAPGDHHAAALAIERVLERGRGAYAAPLRRAAADHAWPRVAEPLVRWVDAPEAAERPRVGVPRTAGHRVRATAYRALAAPLLGRRRSRR